MAENAEKKIETTEAELIEAIRLEIIDWAQEYDFRALAELDSALVGRSVAHRLASRPTLAQPLKT